MEKLYRVLSSARLRFTPCLLSPPPSPSPGQPPFLPLGYPLPHLHLASFVRCCKLRILIFSFPLHRSCAQDSPFAHSIFTTVALLPHRITCTRLHLLIWHP